MSDTYTEFKPGSYDSNELDKRGFAEVRYGPKDDGKVVLFYMRGVLNEKRSREEGRPINENRIYVKIGEPGEMNLSMIDRPATDLDKQRWPRQWQQFSNNQKQVTDGTPIEMLFPANPALAASLKSYGVHTVEQLSHLSAEGISTVGMGATEWVNKAKAYVERAEKGVSYHKFEQALAERDTKIAVLNNTVDALKAQLDVAMRRLNQVPGVITVLNGPPPIDTGQVYMTPANVDLQTAQINAARVEGMPDFELPASAFDPIPSPKRRGRPPGSKNKGAT